uniref:MIF4G/MA4 domain-containing protein n=1 Tax=Kwoniella dejecticola CBS 10117 TaxID=1296121 RepID=A0A1A6AHL7_9TREE|nr:MIF4G/MA4 domain-containing protein [Kwoniella dejecticola CBS 10117]OBR89570.1 MIF4G/MA4 domain-containing protein [Kwoniella dejecticola CBS 10117]
MPPFRTRGNANGHGSRGRGGSRGGRGGSRGGYGGPKLPSELREQFDVKYKAKRGRGGFNQHDDRSSSRQDGRAGAPNKGKGKGRAPLPDTDSEDEDEEADELPAPPPSKKLKTKGAKLDEEPPKKKKKKLPELRLPDEMVDDAEDQEIEWLEYILKKEKGKGKEVDDDGLDDLLDLADVLGPGGSGLKRDSLNEEDDIEEDDENDADADEEFEESDSEGDDDAMDLVGLDELSDLGEEDEEDEQDEREYISAEEDVEGEDDHPGAEIDLDEPISEDQASGSGQRDSPQTTTAPPADTANSAGPSKYVPPHLRAAQLEENARGNKEKAEERIKLERKSQGLLNKLSEANLESILGEIEGLYRGHSRNDVSTTLTDLVIQMISNKANLLDSFVVLYATLVGALHRVIGMEFGAHFVHTLIMRYQNALSGPRSNEATIQGNIYETPDASKEALNLLTLIAELYNAQVIGSKLIYDLIKGFLENGKVDEEVMGESAVEGLLKVLRCSGTQLRTDDPASLKDIVNLVQEKTKGKEKTMTARARFMVETLTNVKNGKIKSNQNSEGGNEAAMRMKKFLSGLGKKRLLAYEPLRVSLSDLLSADKKGKWWLVGAGWSGNPLVEREQQLASSTTLTVKSDELAKKDQEDVTDEEALLELARKQGMNTDVRRGVFVVLLSSEDYVHACDRLNALKLSAVQQREFVRVALHCCGLEKTYNPYYTLILNELCSNSYDHRFTLQYALWDFLRELENSSGDISKSKKLRTRTGNIAKAIGYVVGRGGLDLTIFKAIDFTTLSAPLLTFLISFLIHFLLAIHTVSPIFTLPKSFNSKHDFDEEGVQEKFEKTLSNTELAGGWLYVLERGQKKIGEAVDALGEREKQIVKRGIEIGRGVLGNAI